MNSDGIVCLPVLETWKGGIRFYSDDQLDAIEEALFKFQQKNDTKAEVGVSLSYSSGQVCTAMTALRLI